MQDEVCHICGRSPCDCGVYEEELVGRHNNTINMDDEKKTSDMTDNRDIGKSAYKIFVYSKCGHLEKGNRIRKPSCVLHHINELESLFG